MKRFLRFVVVTALAILVVWAIAALVIIRRMGPDLIVTPRVTRAPIGVLRLTATPDPFAAFIEVRNDCALCGTDSPVGGWETTDGDTMVLQEDGALIVIIDGRTLRGTWTLEDGRLCLRPESGDDECFTYEQKGDAMRLGGDSLFIRR